MKNTLLLLLFFFFASQNLSAQEVHAYFKNFSFEDYPRPSIAPKDWNHFDFENESPPDIHPSVPPAFEVVNKPFQGKSYVGLVSRANKTWESIAQKLETPLAKNGCYTLSLYLSQSSNYKSKTTWTGDEIINFTSPTILRVWGDYQELLAETPPITHLEWKKYTLRLAPTKKINNLVFEAYYPTESEPTNGHILLDNLSPLIEISCNQENEKLSSAEAEEKISQHRALMEIIQSESPRISFNSKNQLTEEGKVALQEIGRKLFFVSDQKLLVFFKSTNRLEKIHRQKSINKVLVEIGYSIDMFEVRNYKERDVDRNWIYKNRGFYIGLGNR